MTPYVPEEAARCVWIANLMTPGLSLDETAQVRLFHWQGWMSSAVNEAVEYSSLVSVARELAAL